MQTSLVEQSRQDLPTVVQGVHCGYHGAEEIHGGIQGFATPAGGHPVHPAWGSAEAIVNCKEKI